jgi:hypothetical protein
MFIPNINFGTGFTSVSDPDPDWTRFNPVSWSVFGFGIRIRIQEGKKKFYTIRKVVFWSSGCSLLRAEGFFCSLVYLYGGLGKGKLQFLMKKIFNFLVQLWTFPKFTHQNPRSGLDPDWTGSGVDRIWIWIGFNLKSWIRILIKLLRNP